jgi:AcrR family transcriptional regulator
MVQSVVVAVNPPTDQGPETGQVARPYAGPDGHSLVVGPAVAPGESPAAGPAAGSAAGPAVGSPAGSAREKLLAAVLAHVTAHGIGDLSLRELAAAIGTSHRMLIYHFGSREGLMVAIVEAVEAAQHAFMDQLAADPAVSPSDLMRVMWRRLADPALWPSERLFFELYALALQRCPGTDGFLDGIVESWVEQSVDHARRRGMDPAAARVDARLGVAVSRGLLLDLLATGDRPAVDAAVERYLAGYDAITKGDSSPR